MLLTLPMEIRCDNLSTLWQRPPLRQKDVDTIQTSNGTISRHFFSRWRPSFGKNSKPSSFLDIWILSKPFIDDFCLKIVSCFLLPDIRRSWNLHLTTWCSWCSVLVLEHWSGPNDGIPLNPSLTSDSSSPLIMWPGICHPRMKQQKTFIYHEELNRSSQSRINFTPDLLVFNLFYTIFSPRTIKAVTFPQIAEIGFHFTIYIPSNLVIRTKKHQRNLLDHLLSPGGLAQLGNVGILLALLLEVIASPMSSGGCRRGLTIASSLQAQGSSADGSYLNKSDLKQNHSSNTMPTPP